VAELARYSLAGKAILPDRHAEARKLATLLATITNPRVQAVDDAPELLDVLTVTRLLAPPTRGPTSTNCAGCPAPTLPPPFEELWAHIKAAMTRGELVGRYAIRHWDASPRPRPAGQDTTRAVPQLPGDASRGILLRCSPDPYDPQSRSPPNFHGARDILGAWVGA
jgi:hypothetical protein